MRIIDLRSDTVTKPSPAMRQAIANAEVGDDVYGEDPTVNRLEALCAEMMGHEAAVFVCSGTMGNQAAVHAHTRPGDEIIVERLAHIYLWEAGALAEFSSVLTRQIDGPEGYPPPEEIRKAYRPPDPHVAPLTLVCLENSHNVRGGMTFGPDAMRAVCNTAHELGIKVHLDGARIFNAAVAQGCSARDLAQHADSVQFCFSKGLGAPVGSMIVGPAEFIARARHARKVMGGAMRQAGIIAAAALYALEHNVERIAEDHANAKRLAQGLAELPGIVIEPEKVETNIVRFEVRHPRFDAKQLKARLAEEGVLFGAYDAASARMVTHLDVSAEDIEEALAIAKRVLS
jgi:threonine aldolase